MIEDIDGKMYDAMSIPEQRSRIMSALRSMIDDTKSGNSKMSGVNHVTLDRAVSLLCLGHHAEDQVRKLESQLSAARECEKSFIAEIELLKKDAEDSKKKEAVQFGMMEGLKLAIQIYSGGKK